MSKGNGEAADRSERKTEKSVDEELARLRLAGRTGTVDFERALVFKWFRENIENGALRRISSQTARDNQHPIVHELEAHFKSRGLDRPSPLDAFSKRDFSKFTLDSAYVYEIMSVMHRMPSVAGNSALLDSWRDMFGKMERRFYRFRDLVSRNNISTSFEQSPLKGDYLLFRHDNPETLNVAFFRFYDHETGGARAMGLRLDSEHKNLGSKGWVTKQDGAALVVSYVVERRDPSGFAHHNGGSSALSVELAPNRHVADAQAVAFAPCLHFQSIFSMGSSCSRAFIVRFKGFEDIGGNKGMTSAERGREIYDMQNALTQLIPNPFSVSNGCTLLARVLNDGSDSKSLATQFRRHFQARTTEEESDKAPDIEKSFLVRPLRSSSNTDVWRKNDGVDTSTVFLERRSFEEFTTRRRKPFKLG